MNLVSALPVKTKLPLFVAGLCLATCIVLEIVNDRTIRAERRHEIEAQFGDILESRESALTKMLADAEVDLQLFAEMPEVAGAIGSLGAAYRLMPEAALELQQAYIDGNPHPVGERQALDKAEGDAAYHRQHAAVHPMFRKIQESRSLYDIFLFDSDLNNIYTVFKEKDFGVTFKSGVLANSGLGVALEAAEAAEPGHVTFSDFGPYAPSNGAYAAFAVTRVASRSGITMGYVAFQLNVGEVTGILDETGNLGDTGRVFLVGLPDDVSGSRGFVLGTDVGNRAAEDVQGPAGRLDSSRTWPQIEALSADEVGFFDDVLLSNGKNGFASSKFVTFKDLRWGLVVERDSSDVFGHVNELIFKMILAGLATGAVATFVGVLFARSITKPLERICSAVSSIANGDLQVKVVDAERHDELGQIATALNGLLDKLTVAHMAEQERERLREELRLVVERLSSGLKDLAEGNLTRPITEAFAADYDALRVDFNATLQNLEATIAQVVEASQNIRARSTEISTSSEDLSRRSENQAAALEETAAALDQMTASVRSAASGASEVETIVRSARRDAEESGVVVQGAVAAMAEIEKSSEQISQIIGAIDDIAFQTNLLALNAGVEAARAGDAGKGFAVVASEVRALAQRSSTAAKEIKALIATSAQHVGRGVDQVGKAGEVLHSIVGSVTHISSLVSTIATGAAEQSTGLAEINIGVTQLDQVTQQNAAMVQESMAAGHSLHQEAAGLAELVAKFRLPQSGSGAEYEIRLAQFVPTEFEGATVLHENAPHPDANRPAKTARAATSAMWQDF